MVRYLIQAFLSLAYLLKPPLILNQLQESRLKGLFHLSQPLPDHLLQVFLLLSLPLLLQIYLHPVFLLLMNLLFSGLYLLCLLPLPQLLSSSFVFCSSSFFSFGFSAGAVSFVCCVISIFDAGLGGKGGASIFINVICPAFTFTTCSGIFGLTTKP